jgi:hypothetical protein
MKINNKMIRNFQISALVLVAIPSAFADSTQIMQCFSDQGALNSIANISQDSSGNLTAVIDAPEGKANLPVELVLSPFGNAEGYAFQAVGNQMNGQFTDTFYLTVHPEEGPVVHIPPDSPMGFDLIIGTLSATTDNDPIAELIYCDIIVDLSQNSSKL